MVFKSLLYFCSMLGQYIGDGSLETQGMKRKRIEEKDSEGQTSEETERKRIKEERPLKMASKKIWNSEEKVLYIEMLTEYSNGALDNYITNKNYWTVEFWEKLNNVYNNKAATRGLPAVPAYELILHGQRVQGEFCRQRSANLINSTLEKIFTTCKPCQKKVIVFPKSLLVHLGYVKTDRSRSGNQYGVGSGSGAGAGNQYGVGSGSGSGSGAGAGAGAAGSGAAGSWAAGSGASVQRAGQTGSAGDASSVVDLIFRLERAGDLTLNEATALFDQVDIWFKEDHAAWVRFLQNPALTDVDKLIYLKSTLNMN